MSLKLAWSAPQKENMALKEFKTDAERRFKVPPTSRRYPSYV